MRTLANVFIRIVAGALAVLSLTLAALAFPNVLRPLLGGTGIGIGYMVYPDILRNGLIGAFGAVFFGWLAFRKPLRQYSIRSR